MTHWVKKFRSNSHLALNLQSRLRCMYVRIPHATLDPSSLAHFRRPFARSGAMSIQSSDAPFCFPIMIREPSTASTKTKFFILPEKSPCRFLVVPQKGNHDCVPRTSGDRCSLKRYGSPILNSLVLIPPFPHPFHDLESHPPFHGFIQVVASWHLDCDESYVL